MSTATITFNAIRPRWIFSGMIVRGANQQEVNIELQLESEIDENTWTARDDRFRVTDPHQRVIVKLTD